MDLLVVARAFRAALEGQRSEQILPSHMACFPVCCCGVTSELLGEYLKAADVSATYVAGTNPTASHAWLEVGNVVIDITADQFEGRPSVFVDLKSDWYSEWSERSRETAKLLPNGSHYEENKAVLREILRRSQLPYYGL